MKKIIGILFAILVIALLAVGGVILYKWAIKGESPSFKYTVEVEEIEYKDGATIELKLGENIIELKRPFTNRARSPSRSAATRIKILILRPEIRSSAMQDSTI